MISSLYTSLVVLVIALMVNTFSFKEHILEDTLLFCNLKNTVSIYLASIELK